jgi:hypothetical protein
MDSEMEITLSAIPQFEKYTYHQCLSLGGLFWPPATVDSRIVLFLDGVAFVISHDYKKVHRLDDTNVSWSSCMYTKYEGTLTIGN